MTPPCTFGGFSGLLRSEFAALKILLTHCYTGKTSCRFEWLVSYHLCWKKSPDTSQEHILLTRLVIVGNFDTRLENGGQRDFGLFSDV